MVYRPRGIEVGKESQFSEENGLRMRATVRVESHEPKLMALMVALISKLML